MEYKFSLYGVVHLPEMDRISLEVLRSGKIAGGEYVQKFEAGLAKIVGQEHVVSTNDMTSALFLALRLSDVGEGDEVLTTAFACLSTNASIAQCGATPVWVDVKPGTVEIDPDDLKAKISPKTKAVILYHVAGYPGPAQEVAEICQEAGLVLIEDCDNALFSSIDGHHVGKHGEFAIYSFYPNRQINATEGGALVCKSSENAEKARRLRRFGINFNSFRSTDGEISPTSDITDIGWGMTLNNLCAGLGFAQLDSASMRSERVKQNAAYLSESLQGVSGLTAVPVLKGAVAAYWVFLVLVENRDRVMREMKRRGIMVSKVHQRNDVYTGFHADRKFDLPNTDYLQDHILGIPCGWWLDTADMECIVNTLKDCVVQVNLDVGCA